MVCVIFLFCLPVTDQKFMVLPKILTISSIFFVRRHRVQRNFLHELAYQKNGLQAVQHLFDVGAGLDSQILGDYEIVGQLQAGHEIRKGKRFYT